MTTRRIRTRGVAMRRLAGKRRASTAVLALTTMVAVAASVLGVGLLIAANGPFDRAFAAQRGAHLTVSIEAAGSDSAGTDQAGTGPGGTDSAGTDPADFGRATADLPGVVAAAGPFPTATVSVHAGAAGRRLGLLTVVGRDSPDAPVDQLTLTAGRWARQAGEIVLDPRNLPLNVGNEFLGMRMTADTASGSSTVTVVGLARSVTHTANAWATPDTVGALAGSSRGYQMLYRFADASTPTALQRDGQAIAAALPDTAAIGISSYLATRQQLTANAAAFAPFVTAFGVLAVILSVLVIGIVVGGVVAAARRRIGIVKALGCTPGQVARGYVARALLPAVGSVVVGSAAALLMARPILAEMDETYGGATGSLPLWVVLAVGGGVLALMGVAALVPALSMARQRPAALVRRGRQTMPPSAALRIHRAIHHLRLPRAVALGLASPLRRPARSLAMAATIVTGAACLTFALGLLSSLTAVQQSRNPLAGADVQVSPQFAPLPEPGDGGRDEGGDLPPEPTLSDPAAVSDVIAHTAGTAGVFGIVDTEVVVGGLTGGADVIGISGESSFTRHQMVAGRWLSGAAGEVVLPTRALRATGLSVGDRLTLSTGGLTTSAIVVGEVFDLSHDGMRIYTSAGTLVGLGLDVSPDEFAVQVQPGTDVDAYLAAVAPTLSRYGAVADRAGDGSSDVLVVMNGVTALLAAMLLLVAGIGILGTAMLDIRDRVRDLGLFKALGMAPWQLVAMTLTSVGVTGLVAGLVGVPLGMALHQVVVPSMGATAGAVLTAGQVDVYGAPMVAGLLFGGLVLALLGALGPALYAARLRGAVALRTE